MNSYIKTNIGGREENQDHYGSKDTEHGFLVVVCDGMGGTNGGKFASHLAVDTVINEFVNSNDVPTQRLKNAIKTANIQIFNEAQSDKNLSGMGTTIVAALFQKNKAIICHIGDSRFYQFRKGKIIFRTTDHSRVAEQVKRGILTEEQARLSEDANILTRALGIKQNIEVEINEVPFQKGDRFLICSDGIWGELTETEIEKQITATSELTQIVDNLINGINNKCIQKGGGHDNMTVALIEMDLQPNNYKSNKMGNKFFTILVSVFLVASLFYIGYMKLYTKEADLQNEIKELKGTISLQTVKITNLKQYNTNKDSLNTVLRANEKNLNDSIDLLNQNIKKLKTEKQRLNSKLKKIQKELDKLQQKNPQFKELINNIKNKFFK